MIRQLMLCAAAASPMCAIELEEARPIPPKAIPERAPQAAPEPPAAPEARQAGPVAGIAEAEARPYIGVILDPVPGLLAAHLKLAPGEGVVVGDVVGDGPAAAAGIEVNDIITKVNGNPVGSAEEVREEISTNEVGDEIALALIHAGEPKEISLELGAAPAMAPAFGHLGHGVVDPDVDGLDGMLDRLPGKHADMIREALERNLQAMEEMRAGGGLRDQFQRDFLQRMERRFNDGNIADGVLDEEFNTESSIRLLDDQGSVEMKSRNGSKEAKVFDKEGNLIWEGPYDTPQDKAAVPDDIRERMERLDFDMNFQGNGLKLRLGPQRFRALEDLRREIDPADGR